MDANNTTPIHQAPRTRQESSNFAYHPYIPGPFRPSGHFHPLRPPPPVPYSTGIYDCHPATDENIDPALRNLAIRPPVRPSPSGQTARPVLGVLPNHTLLYPPPPPPPPRLIHPQPISVQALLSHPEWGNGSFLGLPHRRPPPPPPALIPPPAALEKKEEQAELFASLLIPGVLPNLLVTPPSEPSAIGRFQGMDPAERERLEEALRQLACASSPPVRTPPHLPAVLASVDASVHGDAAAAAASLDAELSALNTQLSKPATPEPVPQPAVAQPASRLHEQASSAPEPMQTDEPPTHSTEDVEMAQLLLGLMTATPAADVATGSRRSTPDEPEEDESFLLPPRKRRATTNAVKAPVKPKTTPAKGKAKPAPKAKRAPAKGKGKACVAPPPIPTEEEETPMPKPKYTYSRHKQVAANAPSRSEQKRTVTFAKEDAVRHFDDSSPVSGNSPPPPSGSSSPLSPPDALPSAFRRIVRTKPEAKKDEEVQGFDRPPTPKRARVTRAATARSKALAAKAKAKIVESETSDESEDLLDLIVAEHPVSTSEGPGSANPAKEQEVPRSEERWLEATSVWAAAHKIPTTSRMRSTLRPEDMSSDAVDESDESRGEKTSVTPPSVEGIVTAPLAPEGSAIVVSNDQPRPAAIPMPKGYRWKASKYQQ